MDVEDKEHNVETKLCEVLRKHGYFVIQQCPCDEDKDVANPYKRTIDIYAEHPTHRFMNPIGIELKNVDTSSGSIVFLQYDKIINTYKQLHFNKNKINNWVVGFHRKDSFCSEDRDMDIRRFMLFSSSFFNAARIGFLDLTEREKCLSIMFSSVPSLRLHLNCYHPDYNFDIELMKRYTSNEKLVKSKPSMDLADYA